MKSVSTNAKLKLNKEVVVNLKITGDKGKYEAKRKATLGCCDLLSLQSTYGAWIND